MQMEVVDCLPALRAGIEDKAVTLFSNPLLLRHRFRHQDHVPNQLFIPRLQFIDGGDVPVGDYQDMDGRYGMDITKGRYQVIAVDDPGRGKAGDYIAKDTVHGY